MHPLVEMFSRSSAEISTLLADFSGRESPVLRALRLLTEMTAGGQSANGALFIARNTPLQEEDSDLGIMMICCWATAIVSQVRQTPEKEPEARALIHRARSQITPATPREMLSLVDFVSAALSEAVGNVSERDALAKKAIKRLSTDSPRLPWLTAQYAVMLARSGRLSEISGKLAAMETSPAWSDIALASLLANFVNHVETCNLHQAEQLLPPLTRASLSHPMAQLLDSYRILLPLLRNALANQYLGNTTGSPNEEGTPDWALVIKSLCIDNAQQALKWARISEKREPLCLSGNSLISFNLIRTELAERNIDASRRLTALRCAKGNTHYLDSFFESRALLLEGSTESAAELFCEAVKQAGLHNAKHRLELEMTLAVEVPHHLVMLVTEKSTSSAASKKRLSIPGTTPTPPPAASGAGNIIGTSQATEDIRRTVAHFSRMDVPVMITGETGTGKDLIARAIHEESTLRDMPFIAVNCASISESLLESELFGHEKGAFTGASTSRRGLFEEAGRGYIFLDEIGEISPRLQAALLRVLETGEIRPVGSSTARKTACRIVTATNADLERMAQDGRFRQDILFRLKRLEIHIPPLRQRSEDILPLAYHFLNLNRSGDSSAVMSEALCRTLLSYTWPGNVRELRNVIERMRLMNSDKLYYEAEDIGLPAAINTPRDAAPVQQRRNELPSIAKAARAVPVARAVGHQPFRKGRSRMRRLEELRALFKQYRTLTRSEIIDTLGVSPNIATSDLQELASEGFISREQPTRSPRSAYFRLRE